MGNGFSHFVLDCEFIILKKFSCRTKKSYKKTHTNQLFEFKIIKTDRDMNDFHVYNEHCILTLCLDYEFIL